MEGKAERMTDGMRHWGTNGTRGIWEVRKLSLTEVDAKLLAKKHVEINVETVDVEKGIKVEGKVECWKANESWRFETVDAEEWIRVGGKVECWKVIERWGKRWMLNKKKVKENVNCWKMNKCWRKRWWLKSEKKSWRNRGMLKSE